MTVDDGILKRSLPSGASILEPRDYGLYALTVFVWGTSWIALKFQVGEVAPSVSLVWRFGLAALVMIAWCRLAGAPMRFRPREHARFALLGLFIFSANFLCFYYAAFDTVSGLLAVIFSLASIFNILLGALVLRRPIRIPVACGACLGVAGVALLFAPQILLAGEGAATFRGLGLGVLGTLFFSLGNMVSARIQREGVPILSANAWGMAYGVGISTLLSLALGSAFVIEPTARYLLSLAWLAVAASVVAFWAYLSLLGRIGVDRAGYVTVLFPVVALLISSVVEDYRWTLAGAAGVGLVVAGNVLVMRRR